MGQPYLIVAVLTSAVPDSRVSARIVGKAEVWAIGGQKVRSWGSR